MKFFSVSIFVVLLIGGSFGSPFLNLPSISNTPVLPGLLNGVVNSASTLVDNLFGTVAHITDIVHNALQQIPKVQTNVVNNVQGLIQETENVLVCAVKNVADGVLTFTAGVGGDLPDVCVNLKTLVVSVGDIVIGTIKKDGSILDLEGNCIGLIDKINGVVVFAGETVESILQGVGVVLFNILQTVDDILDGVAATVQNLVDDISTVLRTALLELPCATADIVNAVGSLISQTNEVLVCTVEDIVNNVLTFREVCGEDLVVISIDRDTFEVTLDGEVIGYLAEDGSILDLDGNICGFLDSVGVIVFAGNVVASILEAVYDGVTDSAHDGLGALIGGSLG